MTVKSTIEVDLKGSEAFKDYVKKVEELNKIIGELPAEWAKVAKAMSLAVGAEASRSIATFDNKLEDLRNQMVSLSQTTIGFSNSFRNAEVSAGNIFAAMRGTVGAVTSLAKFGLGLAGGLASSVAGWSQWGLMGMLGLGRQVTSDQSRAYATNTSMGFQQAFFSNPGSIGQNMPGAQGFFSSVMEAEEGFSPMWAQLGVRRTGNTEADFQSALLAAQRKLKAMPANMVKQRYDLLGVQGLSLEGANYLRNMSTQDLQHMLAASRGQANKSNAMVTDEDAVRWRHFVQDIENDFMTLGNILKQQLIPLQGPVRDLFHAFTEFAVKIGESGVVTKAIEGFAHWLGGPALDDLKKWGDEFANWFNDMDGFMQSIKDVTEDIMKLVNWFKGVQDTVSNVGSVNIYDKMGVGKQAAQIEQKAQSFIGKHVATNPLYQGAENFLRGIPFLGDEVVGNTIRDAEGTADYGMKGPAVKDVGGLKGREGAIAYWHKLKNMYSKYGKDSDALAFFAYTAGMGNVNKDLNKYGSDWRAHVSEFDAPAGVHNVVGNRVYAGVVGVPYQQNINIVVPGMPGGNPVVTGAGAAAAGSSGQGRGW